MDTFSLYICYLQGLETSDTITDRDIVCNSFLCVFVGKEGLLCLYGGRCLTVCSHPGSSACPDPVSHGLIGLFECEAAFRLALAASAAICL